MTTLALAAVIVILVWNLAVLYLPFEKKMKARLSLVSFAILIGFGPFMCNEQDPKQDLYRKIAWHQIHNPQTAKAMMAAFNVSENELNTEAHKPTPIEARVFAILAMALITPFLINVVIMDSDDDKETDRELKWLLVLNIVASALLLSLYFGLKLALVPWTKKKLMEGKTSSALNSKVRLVS